MEKHYRDAAGAVWVRTDSDTLRCVRGRDAVHAGDLKPKWEFRYEDRLTEVNPFVDEHASKAIRAELAIVLTELADEIYSPYSYSGVEDDIRTTLSTVLEEKSRSLRASLGMED
ncbi:hypothetical protein [Streptomyces sp. R44]|uniref:Uncharacterized protein n=1 Tax=Streptomyces sp. R44 TaxID=3238633 RepID=A0AB39T5N8_9ACTN